MAAVGDGDLTETVRDNRSWLVGLAAVRAVLGIVAIPLAPVLLKHDFILLVLLRPTKEVLLVGGYLASDGRAGLLPILLAVVPLAIFGVWHFYFLGRAYSREITDCDLPGIAGRVLPPKRINAMADLLEEKGAWIVLLGRLTVFPSSLMAAAAGSTEMSSRRFFPADAAGGLLSVVESLAAGWFLGEAYESAGPWLTGVGVVMLAALVFFTSRQLKGRMS
jgi:membrane protein DedA with SNARE-associated domain